MTEAAAASRALPQWTGGQYSLVRVMLAVFLLGYLVSLLPVAPQWVMEPPEARAPRGLVEWPNPLRLSPRPQTAQTTIVVAMLLCVPLAAGWADRWAALGICYVLLCLVNLDPDPTGGSGAILCCLLLAHAWIMPAPYGSLAAAGRADPDGGWELRPTVYVSLWVLLAGVYLAGAIIHLIHRPYGSWPPALWLAAPELIFVVLIAHRGLRPWLWLVLLLRQIVLIALDEFHHMGAAVILLHLFTFDPAWLAPGRPGRHETVFYDGRCGLCHRSIRFLMAEDPADHLFRFAPLQGATAQARLGTRPDGIPEGDPGVPGGDPGGTVIVATDDGELLGHSAAVIHLLDRLGGWWRVLAVTGEMLPLPLRDGLYDAIAGVRHRLFRQPADLCPLTPPHLRQRCLP
jgi:predicted DCC family thiol-disulfide oxidoreductase YuxK